MATQRCSLHRAPPTLHQFQFVLIDHRSSVVPSRPGPTVTLRSAASTIMMLDDAPSLFFVVPLDTNDDAVTSSTSQATPVAVSYLSQISTNIQASAKRWSSLTRSGLPPLHRKYSTISPRMRGFPPTTLTNHRPRTVTSYPTERSRMPAPCLRRTSLRTSGSNRVLPGRYLRDFVRTISRHAVCGNRNGLGVGAKATSRQFTRKSRLRDKRGRSMDVAQMVPTTWKRYDRLPTRSDVPCRFPINLACQ